MFALGNCFWINFTISTAASASSGALTSRNVSGCTFICGNSFAVRYNADAESAPPDNDTTNSLGIPSSSNSQSLSASSLNGDFCISDCMLL